MFTRAHMKRRQAGAVAIMVGLTLVMLIGFLALVIDLGHLYLAKTGLQNAADAAALSGAERLKGTAERICCDVANSAVGRAIDTAGRNTYFGNSGQEAVTLTPDNIEFSDSPYGPWKSVKEAGEAPADMTFIKVDTGLRDLRTWFAGVLDLIVPNPSPEHHLTKTKGRAVAGYYLLDVAPLGVCAVDKNRPDFGFIRGVSYNAPQLNPLVIQPDQLWINPVNAPPDSCDEVDPDWNSPAKMAGFICSGKTASVRTVPGQVFVNTGVQASSEKELNSRFDDYQGSKCDPEVHPPDTNVKEYWANPTGPIPPSCPPNSSNPNCGYPRDWMEPGGNTYPSQQGITIINRVPIDKTVSGAMRSPPNAAGFGDYGVLWSYARERNFGTGTDHVLSDWSSLYKGEADTTLNGYPPTAPEAAPYPSPYVQESGKYFEAPSPSHHGKKGRRLINVVIIDCAVPGVTQVGPGNKCAALDTLAIGEFFMPVPADLPNNVFVEFSKILAPPMPPAEIRLYR